MARNRPKLKLEVSRPVAALLAFAGVVALVWMFVLGVYLGRHYTPDTYVPPPPATLALARPAQPQPPAPAPEAAQPAAQGGQMEAQTDQPPAAETKFAEDLTRQKHQALSAKTAPRPQPPAAQVPPQPEKFAPATPGRPDLGPYAFQVGAFNEEGRARTLVADLLKAGFPAYLFTGHSVPRYRVRIGPYAKRQEAEKAAAKVSQRLGVRAYLMSGV